MSSRIDIDGVVQGNQMLPDALGQTFQQNICFFLEESRYQPCKYLRFQGRSDTNRDPDGDAVMLGAGFKVVFQFQLQRTDGKRWGKVCQFMAVRFSQEDIRIGHHQGVLIPFLQKTIQGETVVDIFSQSLIIEGVQRHIVHQDVAFTKPSFRLLPVFDQAQVVLQKGGVAAEFPGQQRRLDKYLPRLLYNFSDHVCRN